MLWFYNFRSLKRDAIIFLVRQAMTLDNRPGCELGQRLDSFS
jgi:hypothetical protein